jgi:hypothetical protein
MNTQFKEQQCNVAGLARSWIGYAAGLDISVINAIGLLSCCGWWACRLRCDVSFLPVSRFSVTDGSLISSLLRRLPSSRRPVNVNFTASSVARFVHRSCPPAGLQSRWALPENV